MACRSQVYTKPRHIVYNRRHTLDYTEKSGSVHNFPFVFLFYIIARQNSTLNAENGPFRNTEWMRRPGIIHRIHLELVGEQGKLVCHSSKMIWIEEKDYLLMHFRAYNQTDQRNPNQQTPPRLKPQLAPWPPSDLRAFTPKPPASHPITIPGLILALSCGGIIIELLGRISTRVRPGRPRPSIQR